jgi:hypothetical protein
VVTVAASAVVEAAAVPAEVATVETVVVTEGRVSLTVASAAIAGEVWNMLNARNAERARSEYLVLDFLVVVVEDIGMG